MQIAYITADGPTAILEVSEIFRAISTQVYNRDNPVQLISHSKNVFHITKSVKWADFENGGCWMFFLNRPFAGSGHMVQNKLHWDANNAVGLPKQRNSYQSSPTLLCFGSPTASFASQCNLFRTMWLDPAKGLFPALQEGFQNILAQVYV